jgi:DNA-3-methyladenine glycosylase II
LRGCGLSGQKVAYVKNISEFFLQNKINNNYWKKFSDEEILKQLTSIKGVGTWTAEMFMIFFLLRPDIFPIKDIGVLKAIDIHFGHKERQADKKYIKIAETWRPYRTVATWYLWRSLDPVAVAY